MIENNDEPLGERVRGLVTEYARAAAENGEYALKDSRVANRAATRMFRVLKEIDGSAKNGRLALAPLLESPDPHVRVWAATHLLHVDKDAAVRVLEEVGRMRTYPGGDARTVLEEWRAGRLKIP